MFDGLVLTKLGKAELIKATDEGCLNFTHIAFGDGVTNDLYNLKDGLSHEVARLKITKDFISESLELLLIISYVITIILGQTQST